MDIIIEITPQRIADLMVTAIELNEMTASWCAGVYWRTKESEPPRLEGDPWYAHASTYTGDFQIEVHEIVDETKPAAGANIARHRCKADAFARGLQLMATKYPMSFGEALAGNEDAITADIFLQLVALGEVRYG